MADTQVDFDASGVDLSVLECPVVFYYAPPPRLYADWPDETKERVQKMVDKINGASKDCKYEVQKETRFVKQPKQYVGIVTAKRI